MSMKTKKLRDERAFHLKAAMAIKKKVGDEKRDITPEEMGEFTNHMNVVHEYDEKILAEVQREGGLNGGEIGASASRAGGAFSGEPPKSEWENEKGEPVCVVKKGDSYASLFASRDGEQNVRVGTILRGMITGKWSQNASTPELQAALSTGVNSGAGYMLSPAMSGQVIDLARNQSVVFQAGAQIIPMDTTELVLVKVTADPAVAWKAEGQTIGTGTPTFGRLRFIAKKLGTLVKISKELMMDAANAGKIVEDQISAAMALELDRVALLGAGSALEPCGVFNYPGVTTTGSIGSLLYDDYLDAIAVVENANGVPRTAILTPNQKKTLAQLKEATTNAYLAPPQDYSALQRLVTKQLADTQSVVGDFEQLLVGLRQGVIIEITNAGGDAFANDEIWIKATMRADIQLARPTHFNCLTGIS